MTPPPNERSPAAASIRKQSAQSSSASDSRARELEAENEGMAALRDVLMENWETYAALAATGFLLAKGKGPALRAAAQRWGRAAFQMVAQMTADQLEERWRHRSGRSTEGNGRRRQAGGA